MIKYLGIILILLTGCGYAQIKKSEKYDKAWFWGWGSFSTDKGTITSEPPVKLPTFTYDK